MIQRLVGDVTLEYTALDLPADPGQVLVAYTAEPGSPSHDALRLLATWATTTEQDDGSQQPDDQEDTSRP